MEDEFHLFVTSNASFTHIIVNGSEKTLCGIENEPTEKRNCKFPCSEIRDSYPRSTFVNFVESQRHVIDYHRFCKKCLKKYDESWKEMK